MGDVKTVVILGASPKPDRFAHRALKKLQEYGHKVLLVNPAFDEIEGLKVYPDLTSIREPVHTLTLYVGPERLTPLVTEILDLRPQRVIFNPGTESPEVMKVLEEQRIHYVRGCTLVMLDTGRF